MLKLIYMYYVVKPWSFTVSLFMTMTMTMKYVYLDTEKKTNIKVSCDNKIVETTIEILT